MFTPGTNAVRRRSKKFRLPGKLPPKRNKPAAKGASPSCSSSSEPGTPSPHLTGKTGKLHLLLPFFF